MNTESYEKFFKSYLFHISFFPREGYFASRYLISNSFKTISIL